jgi:hypothetical protein
MKRQPVAWGVPISLAGRLFHAVLVRPALTAWKGRAEVLGTSIFKLSKGLAPLCQIGFVRSLSSDMGS